MQYLDPRADISQAFVQELSLARNAADDAPTEPSGLDVMTLIGLIIERNADDTGYKYLTLPTKTNRMLLLCFDNYAINKIASMFMPGLKDHELEDDDGVKYFEGGIGLKDIALTVDFSHPFDSVQWTSPTERLYPSGSDPATPTERIIRASLISKCLFSR